VEAVLSALEVETVLGTDIVLGDVVGSVDVLGAAVVIDVEVVLEIVVDTVLEVEPEVIVLDVLLGDVVVEFAPPVPFPLVPSTNL